MIQPMDDVSSIISVFQQIEWGIHSVTVFLYSKENTINFQQSAYETSKNNNNSNIVNNSIIFSNVFIIMFMLRFVDKSIENNFKIRISDMDFFCPH